jgi:hypothetical protein
MIERNKEVQYLYRKIEKCEGGKYRRMIEGNREV